MKLLRAIAADTRGRLLLAALLFAVLWQAWLSVAAAGKLADAVRQAQVQKVNVLVTLPFAPERFHVLAFQKYGRVTGTENNTVELRGVNKADLRSIARPYWVLKVDLLPTEGA